MKKMYVLAIAALLAAGCSTTSTDSSTPETESKTETETKTEVAATKDFDGSGLQETEVGSMIIQTGGGSSEDGNVPTIVASPDTLLTIGVETSGFNGEVVTVYVDGMKNSKLNAGDYLNQDSIELTGDSLTPGEHSVEIVAQEDGSEPTIYKKAYYKVEN